MNSDERRLLDVAELAASRGLTLWKVGDDRYKLIDVSTRRVVAADADTGDGLPLSRLEQALASAPP